MANTVKTETLPINPGRTIGGGLRKRLQMMAMKRKLMSPAEAAFGIAQESVDVEDGVNGKPKNSNARENGRRIREVIVRAGAILTDITGKTATHVADTTAKNYEGLAKQRELKRKEEEEKFGGPPNLIQHACEGLEELEKVPPFTRRFFLFGWMKEPAKEIAIKGAQVLLPWTLNRIASIFKIFKP
ncbi:MAG: hypothetical protein HYY52_06605 [Candidatus Melainabacteria bacterium]|nr:hypothetical protein [Candidatus Melainabacteria bacterium]